MPFFRGKTSLGATHMTQFAVLGPIYQDTIIPLDGQPRLNLPGGAVYAAAGLYYWSHQAGVISRLGTNYPQALLDEMKHKGIDTKMIVRSNDIIDYRRFFGYHDAETCDQKNPLAFFSKIGEPLPKDLLGYQAPAFKLDSRSIPGPFTIRAQEFPVDLCDANAIHFCDTDYLTTTMLPPMLKGNHVSTITLDPGEGFMDPAFWDYFPSLIREFNILMISEKRLRRLFEGRSGDLWSMMETIAEMGCPLVVVKRGNQGQYLYDHGHHIRVLVPAYPSQRIIDPTGCGDAFCGGFLSRWMQTYDPIDACIYGNITASLAIEGSGPFFLMDALPGLALARIEALTPQVRRM